MDSHEYRYRIIETNYRYRIIEHKWKQSKGKRIDQVQLKTFCKRLYNYYWHCAFLGHMYMYPVISEIYQTEASNFPLLPDWSGSSLFFLADVTHGAYTIRATSNYFCQQRTISSVSEPSAGKHDAIYS